MVHERWRKSGGFTVVEMIVAMSLSAVTLLSGYELFEALKRAGDTQSADLAALAEIVHGLEQIREDLRHAVPRAESREPIFVGSTPDPDKSTGPARLLEFYSLCAGQGADPFRRLRQMHRVRYELATIEGAVSLYRSAAPVVGPGPTSSKEERAPILDHVEQVKIAFRNGQRAQPSFSSNERLPVGVELTVTAHGQVWPLSVTLPCGASEAQP